MTDSYSINREKEGLLHLVRDAPVAPFYALGKTLYHILVPVQPMTT